MRRAALQALMTAAHCRKRPATSSKKRRSSFYGEITAGFTDLPVSSRA